MRQLKITRSITIREQGSLNKYLQEIGKEDLISAEEEVLLAQRIKQGDQRAVDKLTKANLRFVISVAKKFQNQGLSLPDLINEGNIGLIKAAKKFDETKGFKFISYAVWWIRQCILQALAEQARIVRLPLNQIATINRINRTISNIEQENEREPSPEEIAELLDITTDKVELATGLYRKNLSLDAQFQEGEEGSLLDVLSDPNSPNTDKLLIDESLKTEIIRSLKKLSDREQFVVRNFYGIDCKQLSLEEIGEEIGITRERARQIKEKAIRRLRILKGKQLKHYLG